MGPKKVREREESEKEKKKARNLQGGGDHQREAGFWPSGSAPETELPTKWAVPLGIQIEARAKLGVKHR
jgi:hypothetical protein